MDDKLNKTQGSEALPDKALEDVSGGIYTRPGQCSCYDPITVDGVVKCRNCGRVYSQFVP